MHPFLQACEDGNLSVVKATLQSTDAAERKELFQLTDAEGRNCLHLVAYHDRGECMMYLLTFNELDVTAACPGSGYTALEFVLWRGKERVTEIIKRLHEINNNLINTHLKTWYPLHVAIWFQDLDVVKLLIELGSLANKKEFLGRTALSVAARRLKVDVVRFLIYDTDCDATIGDTNGRLPCHDYIVSLLERDRPATKEEIEFCVEFLVFSYKSPAETVEVYFLLLDCYTAKTFESYTQAHVLQAHDLFTKIAKLLVPHSPMEYFLDRIAEAKLPSDYCLITLTLFEFVKANVDKCKLVRSQIRLHLGFYLKELKSNFVQELFTLYLADESLCREYIAAIAPLEWKFNEFELMSKFRPPEETSSQILFDFMKTLLFHGFNIVSLTKPSSSSLLPPMANNLLNAFIPLSNFVNAPLDLMWMFQGDTEDRSFNFNESGHILSDYNRLADLVDRTSDHFEVVSLKNLARMSVRIDIFESHPDHYEALSLLYNLDIPIELKQFLCYNQLNLKF